MAFDENELLIYQDRSDVADYFMQASWERLKRANQEEAGTLGHMGRVAEAQVLATLAQAARTSQLQHTTWQVSNLLDHIREATAKIATAVKKQG